jgi:hypothetical protein
VDHGGRLAIRPLGGGTPRLLEVAEIRAILARLDDSQDEVAVEGCSFMRVNSRTRVWLDLPAAPGHKPDGWDRALLRRRDVEAMLAEQLRVHDDTS